MHMLCIHYMIRTVCNSPFWMMNGGTQVKNVPPLSLRSKVSK